MWITVGKSTGRVGGSRRSARILCAAALLSLLAAPALADVVTDWHDTALTTFAQTGTPLLPATRALALTHAAIHDAINAVERRYTRYAVRVDVQRPASAEAAASAAARKVLVTLFPARTKELDTAFRAALAALPEGTARDRGIEVGERVASELLAARAGDVLSGPPAYRPAATPGVYVPTPLPIGLEFARARPWLMTRADQFRPAPPPALSSETWRRDLAEVKSLGVRASDRRSAEQDEIARFWIVVWPQSWSPILRQLAIAPDRTPAQNARLFALASLAAADAFIAVFDAKDAFNFWRPITAIRNGEGDDPDVLTWLPLVDTPLHSEYPCAHCIVAGAVETVLEAEFGAAPRGGISMASPTAPGVTRRWERFADIVDEISNARVWGGIHFRNSTRVGERMGRAIGSYALERHLRPVDGRASR